MTVWTRRSVIQAGLAATGASLLGDAFGQTPPLLRAPRRALVIGNSAYPGASLKNPANDARAIAEELKREGFAVTTAIDVKREEMLHAIAAYGESLGKGKPVGLFYFAGHGVQLAWRNYLLPVDARIGHLDDIQKRCVDVNRVIEGIGKAGNPMNVIILDACRDNPFGGDFRVQQKGLSQLDAPPGTLLAYATSPGNVASDGAGANGLYTENLLREMKVPEAKIEDVFKRVRLSVRRSSNGLQIPWESTSLEEDFWFIPPAELKRRSDREAAEEFKREAATWNLVKDSKAPGPLADYLVRYPSGKFSELAQARLDRALALEGEKRIKAVSSPHNPYSKGTVVDEFAFKVGDRYSFRATDLLTKLQLWKSTLHVTSITDTEVIYNKGSYITDRSGNELKTGSVVKRTASQTRATEYAVGKRWSTRFSETYKSGQTWEIELDYKITAREHVAVPAGKFEAFLVEYHGWSNGPGHPAQIKGKLWFAPEKVRHVVARELVVRRGTGYVAAERVELQSYRQS